jgi:positive regulator of sigma E activity
VQPPPDAFVVTVIETPAREITLGDVIFGSLGVVGVLVLLALVLGGALSFLMVAWNRRHPPESEHMPPVSPLVPGP